MSSRKLQLDNELTELTELFLYPIYRQAYEGHIPYHDFRDLFFNVGSRICSIGWAKADFSVQAYPVKKGTPIVVRWDSTVPHLVDISICEDGKEAPFTLTKGTALKIMSQIRFKDGENSAF